jgi:hypothetical protein
MEVVNDPDLTTAEKRAILASWASDTNSQAVMHELKSTPSSGLVRFEDIINALRMLDRQEQGRPVPHYRQVLANRGPRANILQDLSKRGSPINK